MLRLVLDQRLGVLVRVNAVDGRGLQLCSISINGRFHGNVLGLGPQISLGGMGILVHSRRFGHANVLVIRTFRRLGNYLTSYLTSFFTWNRAEHGLSRFLVPSLGQTIALGRIRGIPVLVD